MRIALVFILLAGCATPERGALQKIEWVKLDQATLNRTCDARMITSGSKAWFELKPPRAVDGCFKISGDTCVIYTRPDYALETLGHEVRHCYDGRFHSEIALER